MKIQFEVFWVMTVCSVVVGYLCFGRPYYLHLQGEVNGTGENGTYIGMVCKSPAADMKWEEVIWQLAVTEHQSP